MTDTFLTDEEFENLKVFCDYLLFDNHSEQISFNRFKDCLISLTKQLKINLSEIFFEICGEHKKYITFPRLVKAYLAFKKNDPKYSVDFKNFFSFVFNELLKKPNKKTGRDLPESIIFSTQQFKKNKGLSHIQVFTNKENRIQGIVIEYDEIIQREFFPKGIKAKDLSLKIDLNLQTSESWLDQDLMDLLDEGDLRDHITHIYGTYSSQIESLGFKCSSGKKYHTGNPLKGSPFLIGKSYSKLHLFKMGMKDGGITFIIPTFKETLSKNYHVDYDKSEIDDSFLLQADELIEDEEVLKNEKDHKKKKKLMLVPLVADDEFFSSDSSDFSGDSLDFSFESSSSSDDGKENFKNLNVNIEKIIFADINNDSDEEFESPRENYSKPNLKDNIALQSFENFLYPWDRVTHRSLQTQSLLRNEKNLFAYVEKFRDDILGESEYRKHKQLSESSYNNNFYVGYSTKTNKKSDKAHKEEDENLRLEHELHNLIKKHKDAVNNHSNRNNLDNLNIQSEKGYDYTLTPNQLVDKWKSMGLSLKKKLVFFGVATAAAVNKASKIMHSIENNFVDDFNSFDDKIKTFNLLSKIIENKTLAPHLTKIHNKVFKDQDKTSKIISEKKQISNELKKKTEKIKLEKKKKSEKKANTKSQTNSKKLPALQKKQSLEYSQGVNKHLNKLIKNTEQKINETSSKDGDANLKKELKILKTNKKKLVDKKINNLKDQIKGVDINKIKNNKEKKRLENQEKLKEEIKLKKQEHLEIQKKNMAPPITFSEIELPKDTEIYRSQAIVKGVEFTDTKFEPKKSSLCPTDKNGNWAPPEGITVEEDLNNWENIEWKRIDCIFGDNKPYQVFEKGIDSSDILQGTLGDCYFLSAVSALCNYPELIQKLFLFKERSLDRMYGVNLRINGLWETVLVDDYVPAFKNKKRQLAFTRAHGNEMWVILLEKAWAKVNGSYAKVIAGNPSEAFDALCNAYSEKTQVISSSKDSIWTKIFDGVNHNYLMTAGTTADQGVDYDSLGLVPGHAYSLVGGTEQIVDGKTIRLVKLRNPWGEQEWNGDWSDSSNKWTDQLRNKLKIAEQDDGMFYMSLEDFVTYYQILEICKIHTDFRYSYLKYNKEFTLAPQISVLNVENNTKAFIQMHQKNPRFLLANGKYGVSTSAYILIVDEKLNYVASISGEENNITVEVDIQKGTYYLITDMNYRYINKNELHGYNLSIYSEHAVSINKNEDQNLNVTDILKTSLSGYYRGKCKPVKKNNGTVTVYECVDVDSKLPFVGCAVENNSKSVLEVEYCYGDGSSKKRNSGFYPDPKENCDKIVKKIEPKETEVFISLYYDRSKGFSIPNYRILSK